MLYTLGANCESTGQVQRHLANGTSHLEIRQYSDALINFNAAFVSDPNNYETYFRRAIAFLGLWKYNQALRDFDKVIQLKPEFTNAIFQRGTLLLKQCKLAKANIDFELVVG